MFNFAVRNLGFLKQVPLVPVIFDSWFKFWVFLFNPKLSVLLDELEQELLEWEGVTVSLHKYGGMQFDFGKHELGHVHSNGLVDILLNLTFKKQLLQEGRVSKHHVFDRSGWISFQIRTADDKDYALQLFDEARRIKEG